MGPRFVLRILDPGGPRVPGTDRWKMRDTKICKNHGPSLPPRRCTTPKRNAWKPWFRVGDLHLGPFRVGVLKIRGMSFEREYLSKQTMTNGEHHSYFGNQAPTPRQRSGLTFYGAVLEPKSNVKMRCNFHPLAIHVLYMRG